MAEVVCCSVCGNLITGQYVRDSSGRYYCQRDYERIRPRCHVCGRPIQGNYYTVKDDKYCIDCYKATRPRCSQCQQLLQGKYYIQGKEKLCPSCYDAQIPRCSRCGTKLTGKYYSGNEANAKRYCEKCYVASLPTCECCGRRMSDYLIFFDGVTACHDCVNNKALPTCSQCDAPVNVKKSPALPGGTYVCSKHRAGAITDIDKVKLICDQVRRDMVKVVGVNNQLSLTSRITLTLTTPEGLRSLHNGVGGVNMKGFCSSAKLGPLYKHDIYVTSGLDAETLKSVLAHELSHAWQFENNSQSKRCASRFKEGFAEWCSYKLMGHYGYKRIQERMLHNQALDYSEGLKMYLRCEKRFGLSYVLKMARENTDFPKNL